MTSSKRTGEHPIAALIAPDIVALLKKSPQLVAAETEELHPADLADVAETLSAHDLLRLLKVLPRERAADVLEYLNEELRAEALEAMNAAEAAGIISEMTPDDRADVLDDLEDDVADEILSEIPAEARAETEKLLSYEPDTAGGIMTTEYIAMRPHATVEDALAEVRAAARSGRREALYHVYVTDDNVAGGSVLPAGGFTGGGGSVGSVSGISVVGGGGTGGGRLVGVLSLRELLSAPDGALLGDVAREDVVTVPTSADREEVARVTREYDLVAVPVVDESGRIVGVVTVDDVIDAIVDEQTEDVQRQAAVEPLEEPYFQVGFWSVARKRAGWLVLLFLGSTLTVNVLQAYGSRLLTLSIFTLFLPLIVSAGGNSGSQSASLITRALAVGDVNMRDAMRVLLRECGQGLLLGAFLGLIGFVRVLAAPPHPDDVLVIAPLLMAAVVGVTVVAVVLTGTVVGAMLPLILRRIGVDPAIASSPFIASFVDITGIAIYLAVASWILSI
jgi:magnesium transporter